MTRIFLIAILFATSSAFAESLACSRDTDCPGAALCSAGVCRDQPIKFTPTTREMLLSQRLQLLEASRPSWLGPITAATLGVLGMSAAIVLNGNFSLALLTASIALVPLAAGIVMCVIAAVNTVSINRALEQEFHGRAPATQRFELQQMIAIAKY